METRENILKELKEVAPVLASMPKVNLYSVPDGYFDAFATNFFQQMSAGKVKTELETIAPVLAGAGKKEMAEVPSGYFKSFPLELLNRIRAEEVARELQQTAPILSGLQKPVLPEVPADYFSSFPTKMMQQVAVAQKTTPRTTMPQWIETINQGLEKLLSVVFKPKYSFAFAATASVIILSAVFLLKVQQNCADIECKMAQLSDEELNSYLQETEYLNSPEIFELNPEVGSLPAEDISAMKAVFSNLSDEELNNAMLN